MQGIVLLCACWQWPPTRYRARLTLNFRCRPTQGFISRSAFFNSGHSDAVRALAVANDRLFSGSYDGTVKVWDVKTMECLQTLAGHTGPVRTLVYSGGHIFSGSYDKTVRC